MMNSIETQGLQIERRVLSLLSLSQAWLSRVFSPSPRFSFSRIENAKGKLSCSRLRAHSLKSGQRSSFSPILETSCLFFLLSRAHASLSLSLSLQLLKPSQQRRPPSAPALLLGHPVRLEGPLEALGLRSQVDVLFGKVQEARPRMDPPFVQEGGPGHLRGDVPGPGRRGQGGAAVPADSGGVRGRQTPDQGEGGRRKRRREWTRRGLGEHRVGAGRAEARPRARRRGRPRPLSDGEP